MKMRPRSRNCSRQHPRKTLRRPTRLRTRRNSAKNQSSDGAESISRNGSKKRTSCACICRSFKKSRHAQRCETRLELSLVAYSDESQHGRTKQQKVPAAIEGAEHRHRQDRAVGNHLKYLIECSRISLLFRIVHANNGLKARLLQVSP